MGDFNLDLLQYNHYVPTQDFMECLFSHAFLPLAHIESNSPEFLFCNINWQHIYQYLSTHVFTGIVLNDLSGHFPICALFYGEVLPHKSEKKLLKRSFKEDNLNKFNESLTLTDWLKLLNSDDLNESYRRMINEYSRQFDSSFPIKCIKGKQMNKFRSPWLTRAILKSINRKNSLYKKLIKSPSRSCELQYKTYKNKLNHIIRIAKRSYYDNKYGNAKKDLKLTWKLLNEVIN